MDVNSGRNEGFQASEKTRNLEISTKQPISSQIEEDVKTIPISKSKEEKFIRSPPPMTIFLSSLPSSSTRAPLPSLTSIVTHNSNLSSAESSSKDSLISGKFVTQINSQTSASNSLRTNLLKSIKREESVSAKPSNPILINRIGRRAVSPSQNIPNNLRPYSMYGGIHSEQSIDKDIDEKEINSQLQKSPQNLMSPNPPPLTPSLLSKIVEEKTAKKSGNGENEHRFGRSRRLSHGLSSLAVQSLSNLAKKRASTNPTREGSPIPFEKERNSELSDSARSQAVYNSLLSQINKTDEPFGSFNENIDMDDIDSVVKHNLDKSPNALEAIKADSEPNLSLNLDDSTNIKKGNKPYPHERSSSQSSTQSPTHIPIALRRHSRNHSYKSSRHNSLILLTGHLSPSSTREGSIPSSVNTSDFGEDSESQELDLPYLSTRSNRSRILPELEYEESVNDLDPTDYNLPLGDLRQKLLDEIKVSLKEAQNEILVTISSLYKERDFTSSKKCLDCSETRCIKHLTKETDNKGNIDYFASKGVKYAPKAGFINLPYNGRDFNNSMLLLHSNSWPPSYLVSSYTILLNDINAVAHQILNIEIDKMLNSTICADIIKKLQSLQLDLRRMTVGNAEAEDILTKLIFEFSPVSRLVEGLHEFDTSQYEAYMYENQYGNTAPPSPSPLRHSYSFTSDDGQLKILNSPKKNTLNGSMQQVDNIDDNVTISHFLRHKSGYTPSSLSQSPSNSEMKGITRSSTNPIPHRPITVQLENNHGIPKSHSIATIKIDSAPQSPAIDIPKLNQLGLPNRTSLITKSPESDSAVLHKEVTPFKLAPDLRQSLQSNRRNSEFTPEKNLELMSNQAKTGLRPHSLSVSGNPPKVSVDEVRKDKSHNKGSRSVANIFRNMNIFGSKANSPNENLSTSSAEKQDVTPLLSPILQRVANNHQRSFSADSGYVKRYSSPTPNLPNSFTSPLSLPVDPRYSNKQAIPLIVCRLCEESIESTRFDEHSKICLINQNFEVDMNKLRQSLAKITSGLDKYRLQLLASSKNSGYLDYVPLQRTEALLNIAQKLSNIEAKSTDKIQSKGRSYTKRVAELLLSYPKKWNDITVKGLADKLLKLISKYTDTLVNYRQELQTFATMNSGETSPYFEKFPQVRNNSGGSNQQSPSNSPKESFFERSFFPKKRQLRTNSNISGNSQSDVEGGSSTPRKLYSLLVGMLKRSNRRAGESPTLVPREDQSIVRPIDINTVSSKSRMPSIEDFEIIKPISRGAFGRVYLTRKKATQDLFAIKVIRKDDMVRKNMVRQVMTERRVMSLASTPYVVSMFFAFHSRNYLYLVMEYMIGGDLSTLLQGFGTFSEEMCRFYVCETVLALEYLHKNNVIHRDLKPDNILLDAEGHIKLTDFGLSRISIQEQDRNPLSPKLPRSNPKLNKRSRKYSKDFDASTANPIVKSNSQPLNTNLPEASLPNQSSTHPKHPSNQALLGTPDYLAPELLLGIGHDASVDWWALGVCMFEFLVGYPPFTDASPELIFNNILSHTIEWPSDSDLSSEAISLIQHLLEPNPTNRYKESQIKAHPFFSSVDWDNLSASDAPFKPNPLDKLDTSYFELRNQRPDILQHNANDKDPFDQELLTECSSSLPEQVNTPTPLLSPLLSPTSQNRPINDVNPNSDSVPRTANCTMDQTDARDCNDTELQTCKDDTDFEAFEYKNLALLSEYNKEMSNVTQWLQQSAVSPPSHPDLPTP